MTNSVKVEVARKKIASLTSLVAWLDGGLDGGNIRFTIEIEAVVGDQSPKLFPVTDDNAAILVQMNPP